MRPAATTALCACFLLAFAGSSLAAQRYAAPGANGPEPCAKEAPCSLAVAVKGSGSEDEVIVAGGEYTIENPLAPGGTANDLFVHGDFGEPMPKITAAFGGTPALVMPYDDGRVAHLSISAIGSQSTAIYCTNGGSVDRVVASSTGLLGTGLRQTGDCAVRDTLATSSGSGSSAIYAEGGITAGEPQTAIDRNVTAIARGAGSAGVRTSNGNVLMANVYTLDLENAIASGELADLEATSGLKGPGNIEVGHSDFDQAKGGETATVIDSGGNIAAPALFVDAAAGDFREAAGSPTIDAGFAEQIGPLDLSGGPRTVGVAPDMGAYEFVPESVGQLLSLKVTPRRFRSIAVGESIGGGILKSKPPVRTGVSYSLSDAAAISFSVERKLKGRRAGKRCVKQTRANRGKKRCARFVRVKGGFTVEGGAGEGRFTFTGKIAGKPLKKGGYRLVGSAGGTTKRSPFAIAGVFRPAPK